ncbi:hypothetical protein ACFSTC_07410 [Nonomuraea ferruginea]
MAAEKVCLDGEKATLLATLYGRALDARSPEPILNDTMAARAVERIDHDFTKIGMSPPATPERWRSGPDSWTGGRPSSSPPIPVPPCCT